MAFAVTLYDVVKALHIMAVVGAFGLPLAYPLLLPYLRRTHPESLAGTHEVQLFLNRRVTGPGVALVLIFGVYLASKADVWSELWVIVPLLCLIAIGGIGGAIVNPAVEKLIGLAKTPDSPEYAAEFARYERFERLLGGLVLLAIFFMAAKP